MPARKGAGPNPKSKRTAEMPIHFGHLLRSPRMSSARLQPAPPDSAESLPWSTWAKDFGHLVWLRLLSHRIAPDRARELSQEVWEQLYRRWINGTLVDVKMPGLALSHADFLALSERRRRTETPLGRDHEWETVRPRDAEQHMLDRAHLARVVREVRSCSSTVQRIFELRYYPPGMSTVEISHELGLSHQRVRQILCELRQRIRRFS